MKSFVVSSCLLVIFIILTSVNCVRVGGILDSLLDSLSELPESQDNVIPVHAKSDAEEICSYWRKNRGFLSLSVNNAELRDCETALFELCGYSDSDTGADYNTALSKARIRIGDLARRESVSLSNIF